MREIKFRAWDKYNKVMQPLLSILPNMSVALSQFRLDYIGGIMQYTGLKDKNGKEIYEKDVIQWWNKTSKPQVVEATNGGWNPFIDGCTTDHPYHYIVIGNIYENPELLDK